MPVQHFGSNGQTVQRPQHPAVSLLAQGLVLPPWGPLSVGTLCWDIGLDRWWGQEEQVGEFQVFESLLMGSLRGFIASESRIQLCTIVLFNSVSSWSIGLLVCPFASRNTYCLWLFFRLIPTPEQNVVGLSCNLRVFSKLQFVLSRQCNHGTGHMVLWGFVDCTLQIVQVFSQVKEFFHLS